MGVQDYIFDVQSALEGKPEAEAFDKLVTYIGNLERANFTLNSVLQDIREGARALKSLMEDS
jgi:hypothetical protein